jgi:hypothetical protein
MTREKLMNIYSHVQGEILAKECILLGLMYTGADVPTLDRLGVLPANDTKAELKAMQYFTTVHMVETVDAAIRKKDELEKRIQQYRDASRHTTLVCAIEGMYPDA